MLLLPDQKQIPYWMVKDHQHIGLLIESHQNLKQPLIVWIRGEIFQRLHPHLRSCARKIVYAQMEILHAPIRNTPLHRNRNAASARNGTEKHRSLDVVVIGNGNHGSEIELFDLTTLQIESQLGSHRRRPVARCVVNVQPMNCL